MYGKLIDNNLIIAPKVLPGEGTIVYNPPASMYAEQGWKPVEFTVSPEAPEGYHYEAGWEETDEAIIQTWTLVKDPDDIDEAEAFDILFGGAE